MARQERVTKQASTTRQEAAGPETTAGATAAPDLTITDELLDEIDAVLEENAEEFVAQYIQKGGQ